MSGASDGISNMTEKYVPTLKAREAEIKALLRAPAALEVTPLFELQEASPSQIDRATGVPKRGKGSATDAAYFMDDIARLWDAPLYVDISRVAKPGTREAWWQLLEVLNTITATPIELIPVLVPGDTSAVLRAAAGVAKVSRRAALRIPMMRARTSPSSVATLISGVASEVAVPEAAVDVVLDWADGLESLGLDQIELDTAAVIGSLGTVHGDLITIGTPNSARFLQAGDWQVARREWWLWLRLAAAGHPLTFGDYALYPPSAPVPVSPSYGHLRYSSGDWLNVHRRAIPPTGGGLGGAFTVCCEHLIRQSHWLGAAFSGADQRFSDIAAHTDKESSAGKWRQLATEHHLALVATQLSSPPSPPPPGTP